MVPVGADVIILGTFALVAMLKVYFSSPQGAVDQCRPLMSNGLIQENVYRRPEIVVDDVAVHGAVPIPGEGD